MENPIFLLAIIIIVIYFHQKKHIHHSVGIFGPWSISIGLICFQLQIKFSISPYVSFMETVHLFGLISISNGPATNIFLSDFFKATARVHEQMRRISTIYV